MQKRKRSEAETTLTPPSNPAQKRSNQKATQCRSGNAKPARNSIQWQQLTGKGGRTLIVAVSHPADSPHPVRKRLAGHGSAAATSGEGGDAPGLSRRSPGHPAHNLTVVAHLLLHPFGLKSGFVLISATYALLHFVGNKKKLPRSLVANTDLAIFLCSEGKT